MNFEILKGKILVEIKGGVGDDEMSFITDTGDTYKLYHLQD